MSAIYEPSGKAREYSPLALNIYSGCDHNCRYCYVQNIIRDSRTPQPKNNLLVDIGKEAARGIDKQVLLCFMGDPYCNLEMSLGLTRQALMVLNQFDVPVAILTKGGPRIYRDLDIIKKFKAIKIGATLTFDNDRDSSEWEPDATGPEERIEMLSRMHDEGIKTWVSIEPVISPRQSLNLIKKTLGFVEQYKVGRWNHDPRAEKTDWAAFGKEAVGILRGNDKQFYIKNDLSVHVKGLKPEETTADLLAITAKHARYEQSSLFSP